MEKKNLKYDSEFHKDEMKLRIFDNLSFQSNLNC